MDISNLIEKYQSVLVHNLPKSEKKRKTILDIGGYPHYENVLSNFYAFYFNKDEEHGFKDLFIKSIIEIITLRTTLSLNFENYDVWTEETTNSGGRIDILIKEVDSSQAIIIENKVNHILLNDLADYWDSVLCTTKNKIGIVLSKKEEYPDHPNFINITHVELIKRIEYNIGSYMSNADDRHLLFFKDFTQNIKNISTTMAYQNERTQFFFENMKKVEELFDMREEYRSYYLEAIKIAAQQLGYTLENTNPKYYRCVLINSNPNFRFWLQMNFSEPNECFEIYLEAFGQNKELATKIIENKKVLEKSLKNSIIINIETEEKNGVAFAHKHYPLDAISFQNLSDSIIEIINNDWKEFADICISSASQS